MPPESAYFFFIFVINEHMADDDWKKTTLFKMTSVFFI